MWLQRLHLENFRGFSDLTLDLDRQVTLLIGINGAGKTSVVDAIQIGASQAVLAMFPRRPSVAPVDDDVRIDAARCLIALEFSSLSVEVEHQMGAESDAGSSASHHSESELPPLVLVFMATRAVLKTPRLGSTAIVKTPHPAWDDYDDRNITAFEFGEWWFREREDLENQERVRRRQLDYVDAGLAAVRSAMEGVLPGYTDPRIDRNRPVGPGRSQLVLRKDGLDVAATMLSDGERSLLVLAMTIARRLSLLDAKSQAAERLATVVIDEIELHLHPQWQRRIIPALVSAFPKCQFIITTHSPQVIGSVEMSSLLVLDQRQVSAASAPTRGRDSNAILAEVMAAGERDADSQARLQNVSELLDAGDPGVAAAIDEIAARWGENDREVIRLRAALQFRDL